MAISTLSVVVHGHFYQPPRENPWSGEVPLQPSAAPFHDWNERIERECYGPVTDARIIAGDGAGHRTLNALAWMSFDFGPTLLSWMERHAQATYARVLQADLESRKRLGHGNAMAMAYHHPILPLSDPRDRRTEIRWGIADFENRFGRRPEGMWLPETAVDTPTLEALAAEGILFTVLAPHQVVRVPAGGRPGRFVTPGGREIALFVYDGGLSHSIAFGDLVRDGDRWAETMSARGEASPVALRSVATDGETFGHHHEFAEMGLAAALDKMAGLDRVTVDNFASFLAHNPPEEDVELVEPSAWSCAHGVDRWGADCGCKADPSTSSSQDWRAPLRSALEWLAAQIHRVYEREGSDLLRDPWAARDAFGAVVATTDPAARSAFLDRWTEPGLDETARARAGELLSLEHDALRLFTSCAWFFDDPARVEPKQVLAYAAHGLSLVGGSEAEAIERGLMERLRAVVSNDPAEGTGVDLIGGVRPGAAEKAG